MLNDAMDMDDDKNKMDEEAEKIIQGIEGGMGGGGQIMKNKGNK